MKKKIWGSKAGRRPSQRATQIGGAGGGAKEKGSEKGEHLPWDGGLSAGRDSPRPTRSGYQDRTEKKENRLITRGDGETHRQSFSRGALEQASKKTAKFQGKNGAHTVLRGGGGARGGKTNIGREGATMSRCEGPGLTPCKG